jgi:tetratricopeptide (TPR) repeat protein
MKKVILFIFSAFILFSIVHCTGSASLAKRAAKLDQAGMIDEAADFYYEALLRNPQNVNAKIGLKTTASKVVDRRLNDFFKVQAVGDDKDAVYQYLDIQKYIEKTNVFVKVDMPGQYESMFEESKGRYLKRQYEKANQLLYEQRYKEADVIFKEIVELDPSYGAAQEKSELTEVEPLYQSGLKEFDLGNFRSAYGLMSRVLQVKSEYKDAFDYKQMALQRAQLRIAVVDVKTSINVAQAVRDRVYASIIQELTASKDPFIRVLDRRNTQLILDEQRINMETSSTAQIGDLTDANTLLTPRILNVASSGSPVKSFRRQGFEQYRVQKVNPRTKETYMATEYRKVFYTEYQGSSEVSVSIEVQLTSSESGELITSQVFQIQKQDQVNYAQYKGNHRNLYSGSFSNVSLPFSVGDKVFNSSQDKQALNQKFTTQKRTLKTNDQLTSEAVQEIGARVRSMIENYKPTR